MKQFIENVIRMSCKATEHFKILDKIATIYENFKIPNEIQFQKTYPSLLKKTSFSCSYRILSSMNKLSCCSSMVEKEPATR